MGRPFQAWGDPALHRPHQLGPKGRRCGEGWGSRVCWAKAHREGPQFHTGSAQPPQPLSRDLLLGAPWLGWVLHPPPDTSSRGLPLPRSPVLTLGCSLNPPVHLRAGPAAGSPPAHVWRPRIVSFAGFGNFQSQPGLVTQPGQTWTHILASPLYSHVTS